MPYAEPAAHVGRKLAKRIAGLKGRTIGIANNSWNCMNVIANEYSSRLLRDYGVKEIVVHNGSSAVRLPKPMIDDLVIRCDAVIVGIGN